MSVPRHMTQRFCTKNFEILEPALAYAAGVGVFEFTDDYSVFDYARMPDRIPRKGEAVARMAAWNFRLLEARGIPTHFRTLKTPNRMEFALLRRFSHGRPVEAACPFSTIPLQVRFRSSWSSSAQPHDVQFISGRNAIDEQEARVVGGLTGADTDRIEELVREIDDAMTARACEVGIQYAGETLEFGMLEPGEVIVIGTVATPEHNRFAVAGEHVDDGVVRDHYRLRGLERDVQRWAAAGRPRSLWPEPEPLPPGFVSSLSDLFCSFAERWIGEEVWGTPPLEEAMDTVRLLSSSAVRW